MSRATSLAAPIVEAIHSGNIKPVADAFEPVAIEEAR
jgi:hypothetical protein